MAKYRWVLDCSAWAGKVDGKVNVRKDACAGEMHVHPQLSSNKVWRGRAGMVGNPHHQGRECLGVEGLRQVPSKF